MSIRAPFAIATATLAFAGHLAAQQLTPQQQFAKEVYKELLEYNTVNIGGGTTIAANAMAKRFRDAGFAEQDVFVGGVQPNKHNLVVRYRGKGGANAPKPVLLLAHLDVVEALKADWSPDLDPFKFTERDGYFYARGSQDDKAMAAIFVANLIQFRKENYQPDRDIVLALTADEEGGCCNGVRWLIQNHRQMIDAAFAINEGGRGSLRDDKPFLNGIQAAEKTVSNFKVVAKNKGGHSSVPRPDNAIYDLAAGIARFSKFAFPVNFNPVTRVFFERTAAIETPEMARAMRALLQNPQDAAANAIVSRDVRYNSILRTNCVATQLTGGHASNALPQTAEVNINCRVAPGDAPADVRAAIIKALGDSTLEVSAAGNPSRAEPSSIGPEIMAPVEQVTRELFGGIPVIPEMSAGATDSRMLREIGIPSYGVSGLMTDPNDNRAHGKDERMRIKSFFDGQEFLLRLTKLLATTRTVP
ncbi:MAG: M20/M25/M40 family metallo-hydrolase [Gemmatimonadota bacterium]|nr:M20/M25/M40 family metallo-hydrolase [Gemmatimonadota bacterium]